MARTYDELPDHLIEWIGEQPVFFVASAPLAADGHVNVSPKDGGALRVLSRTEVGYLDVTGSGAETIAHSRENGRLTIMLCSFGEKPQILRMYGRSSFVLAGEDGWDEQAARFPEYPGARSIVRLAVERISTSCGYGVPIMEFVRPRPTMAEWSSRKTPEELAEYRTGKNATSIDGLPALAP